MAERIVHAWPRGMPLDMAVSYCGVGPNTLRDHGPKPVRVGCKRQIWLKEDLDDWLDSLAGRAPASVPKSNPWATDGIDPGSISAEMLR